MKRIVLITMVLLLLVSPTLAQDDFCVADFNYDGNVDGLDVGPFLAEWNKRVLSNGCPPDGPAPVAWSGQMTSYATGDDGDLERGVHWAIPRFVDNGDGTATDKATGLIWLKDAYCFGRRTWDNALSDCNGLADGQCGLTDGSSPGDWRLPSVTELHSVIDYSQRDPAIGFLALLVLQNVQSNYYWSSTTQADITTRAWIVSMYDGLVIDDIKLLILTVWPVRGGR